MRLGRRFLPLLACVLAACDAGHRENPGADNLWPGPELVVVQPGPGQTVTMRAQGPEATGYKTPSIYFDLRNLATEASRKGDYILYTIDGGPARRVEDWSKPIPTAEEGLEAGTHILLACVCHGETDAPYPNPEAMVLRRFHIGGESGKWDLWKTKGTPPRAPLLETGPALFVTSAGAAEGETPRFAFAFKGTGFGTRYRVAYQLDGGDWQAVTKVAPVSLPEAKAGEHVLVVRLEEAHPAADGTTTWKLVSRPFFARNAPKDAPLPGEFNVTRRAFTIK